MKEHGKEQQRTAIRVYGFQRDLPIEARTKVFDDLKAKLSDRLQRVVTMQGPRLGNAFTMVFTSMEEVHAGLNCLRSAGTITYDDARMGTHELIITRDKTIRERQAGAFNSFFYKAVEAALRDTEMPQRKITIQNSKLYAYISNNEDILTLLKFANNTKSADGKYTVEPDYANFEEIGIRREAVDALVSSAMASAREAGKQ